MKKHIVVTNADTIYTKLLRMPMIESFLSMGYKVTVLGNDKEEKWKDYFDSYGIDYISYKIDRNGLNLFKDFKTMLQLRKIFSELDADILFFRQAKPVIYGSIAAKNLDAEIYTMVSGLGSIFRGEGLKNLILSKLMSIQYRYALKQSSKVFFHNQDDKDVFVYKNIVEDSKGVVIPGSGVNMKLFLKRPMPKQPSLLFVGRLNIDKGILDFLKAAEIVKVTHPKVIFNVVGMFDSNPTSISKKQLDYFISKDIVKYHGYSSDVYQHIVDNQILVHPSYHEGLPNVVVEAMSVGRPIITTDAPGCRETVEHGVNGFLIEKANHVELAKSIIRMLDFEDLELMAQKSHEICRNKFDVNIVNKKILETMKII